MAERDDLLWLHEYREISMIELADVSGLTTAELRELVEFGALAPCDMNAEDWRFTADCVVRVRTAARLCHDLELETAALALVLSFLERIEDLEAQVRKLNAASPRR